MSSGVNFFLEVSWDFFGFSWIARNPGRFEFFGYPMESLIKRYSGRGLEDFWQYRPDLNQWSILSMKGSPGRLRGAQFVSISNGLLLFGGEISEQSDECALWFFDPKTKNLEKVKCLGAFPKSTQQSSLIWCPAKDGSDRIFLFGGFHHLKGPSKEFWTFKVCK